MSAVQPVKKKVRKNSTFELLNSRLGYVFKDEMLLRTALTHRSFSSTHNERLEFLGDSILNFIIADKLYAEFPLATEGDLSRLRASLVKGDTLADMARELDLGSFLCLGEGELRSGGAHRTSILADVLEAIIGAVYVDSGMEQARLFILRHFAGRLGDISLASGEKDPKTQLQEWLQARKHPLPHYTVMSVTGDAHSQLFVISCAVTLFSDPTSASAANRKQAEKEAALQMLIRLEKEYGK